MGFFSKKPDRENYPALGPGNRAAEQLANIQGCLETLVDEVPDNLEVIPGDDAAYVFIGKPPKKFGVAWIEGGEIKNFQTVVKENGVQPMVLQGVIDQLRATYEKNKDVDRYTTVIHGKTVVVTPSEELEHDVANLIDKISH